MQPAQDYKYLNGLVQKMVVHQLKQVLDIVGLSKGGLKVVLQNRILQHASIDDHHFMQVLNATIKSANLGPIPTKSNYGGRVSKSIAPGQHASSIPESAKARLSVGGYSTSESHTTMGDLASSKFYQPPRGHNQKLENVPISSLLGISRPIFGTNSHTGPLSLNTPNNQIVEFDSSPFFAIRKALGPTLFTSESNCPMTIHFTLDQETKRLLDPKTSGSYSVFLFMGLPSIRGPARLQYPEGTGISCNQSNITGFSGLKKKPWTCQPANLTPHLVYGGKNIVVIRYSCPTHACHATVQLVENVPIPILVDTLSHTKLLSKTEVLKQRKKTDSEDDIQATLEQVSLKDPLSKCRITLPMRSLSCLHIQCFDCETFLSVNQQLPTWECPICYRSAPYSSLFIDGYLKDILTEVGDVEYVEVTPDGIWRLPGGSNSNVTPAKRQIVSGSALLTPGDMEMFVIDDDDDIGIVGESAQAAAVGESRGANTPMRSTGPAVIDLTLSDSDDDDATAAPIDASSKPRESPVMDARQQDQPYQQSYQPSHQQHNHHPSHSPSLSTAVWQNATDDSAPNGAIYDHQRSLHKLHQKHPQRRSFSNTGGGLPLDKNAVAVNEIVYSPSILGSYNTVPTEDLIQRSHVLPTPNSSYLASTFSPTRSHQERQLYPTSPHHRQADQLSSGSWSSLDRLPLDSGGNTVADSLSTTTISQESLSPGDESFRGDEGMAMRAGSRLERDFLI
ncbi:hypothetical protein BASA61_004023 [Batrachochytrium salamandrivorans]|nr:hypothetical protein BASA61_004023 [Batrachochytrium salamandrivorans]